MAEEKKEEKKLSVTEVRKTISTSLAAAFGFVIALLWNNVVQYGLKLAKVDTTLATVDPIGWVGFIATALVITVVMIIMIILFSRWGSKA